MRLKWYRYTSILLLPENQIIIKAFRRPTESSHQIHASLCVPLIQVHPKIYVAFFQKVSSMVTSGVENLSQRRLHPCLSLTCARYIQLIIDFSQLNIEHFWLTLLLLQGLTSPKPERGCVKTDCFDEALCREYEQHHVMTSWKINHHHHLRLMMMMGFSQMI